MKEFKEMIEIATAPPTSRFLGTGSKGAFSPTPDLTENLVQAGFPFRGSKGSEGILNSAQSNGNQTINRFFDKPTPSPLPKGDIRYLLSDFQLKTL